MLLAVWRSDPALARMRSYEEKKIMQPSRSVEIYGE
jgi:hypothetical protein